MALGDTTTTASNFFKTYYRNHAQKDMQQASKLVAVCWQRAKPISIGGASRNATWEFQRNVGVGSSALTEGGAFAEAVPSKAVNPALGIADMSFTSQWTGNLESMGSSGTAKFSPGKWASQIVTDMMEVIKKTISRMAMWDGTAVLCAALAVSGTTGGYFTITSGGCSIQMFEAGQRVTFRDATSGGTEQLTNQATGGGIIMDVDPYLGRVYLNDIAGGAAADTVAWYGYYDATVINGIRNLISNTGTIEGIDRSTGSNAFWRSTVVDNGGDALGPSAVDLIRDSVAAQNWAREGRPLIWSGNQKTRRWAALSTIGQVRFAKVADMQLGAPMIEIGGSDGTVAFLEDEMFLDSEIFAYDPTNFVKASPEGMEGPQLREIGGSSILPVPSADGGWVDQYQVISTWRGNLGIDACRSSGKLENFVSP